MKCRRIVDGNIVWFNSIGTNSDGTAVNVETSFSEKQQSVVDSLTQRLNVIKTELWYSVSYGLPLFDKIKNKIAMDSSVVSIVMSHPDVISISSFESTVNSKKYECKFTVTTNYGDAEVIL